jgi:hypothetical protein
VKVPAPAGSETERLQKELKRLKGTEPKRPEKEPTSLTDQNAKLRKEIDRLKNKGKTSSGGIGKIEKLKW